MDATTVVHEDGPMTRLASSLQGDLRAQTEVYVDLIGSFGDDLVPVATGALKASRRKWMSADGMTGGQTWGGGDVDYAVYVHDGTVFMPARPWAFEAMVRAQKEYLNVVRRIMSGGG